MEGGPPTGPAPGGTRRAAAAAAAAAIRSHTALCRWVTAHQELCCSLCYFLCCTVLPCSTPASLGLQPPGTARRLPTPPPLPHVGCGCPYSWAPGCRLCDWGDSWLQQAHASLLPKPGAPVRLSPIRPLKVAFCIPHHNVTGGLKMLLEQVNGGEEQRCRCWERVITGIWAVSRCRRWLAGFRDRRLALPASNAAPARWFPRRACPTNAGLCAAHWTPPADAAAEGPGAPHCCADTLRHGKHGSAALERRAGAHLSPPAALLSCGTPASLCVLWTMQRRETHVPLFSCAGMQHLPRFLCPHDQPCAPHNTRTWQADDGLWCRQDQHFRDAARLPACPPAPPTPPAHAPPLPALACWTVQADEGVVCRQDQRFRDVYNVDSCDVVITGIFHQVGAVRAAGQ